MTEDAQVEANVDNVSTVAENIENKEPVKELTQIEKEEMARGWRPDGKKSAEEFRAYREEYNNSLDRLKAELRDTKKSVDLLLKEQVKLVEDGQKRALAILKKEQEEAALIGDVTTVNKKTEEMIELSRAKPADIVQEQQVPQEYLDFIDKHKSWFVKPGQTGTARNVAVTQYAQQREVEITQNNPNLTASEILSALEDDLRATFPGLIKESSPSFVVPKSQVSPSAETSYHDLSDFHKQMIAFNKQNVQGFDEKKYIEQVHALRKQQ